MFSNVSKIVGDMFDIHGGGEDLIFPHHEDEIAQSEALTGKPPAKYWMHNGMIIVRGDKMSKSLGNTFLVREAVRKYGKDGVKLFLLSKHYRSPIEFSNEVLEDNSKAAQRVHAALNRFREKYPYPLVPKEDTEMKELVQRFVEALSDDFNTPVALAIVFDVVRELNKAMDNGDDERALKMYHLIKRVFGPVLGVFDTESERKSQTSATSTNFETLIKSLVNMRNEFRKSKQFDLLIGLEMFWLNLVLSCTIRLREQNTKSLRKKKNKKWWRERNEVFSILCTNAQGSTG